MTYHGQAGATISRYSKSIVALLGSVLTVLTALVGVFPEPVNGYIAVALAVATGVSTYLIRNTPSVVDLADQAAELGYDLKARAR
jgi:hypothetical protein